MRGRKPKPPALKLLAGNPGKRPIRTSSASVPGTIPRCPAWLSQEAHREWRRVAPHLAKLGLLDHLDRAALVGYCQSWARYVEAEAIIAEEGMIVVGHRGVLTKHPALRIANDQLVLLRAFCVEFGLTPSSRGRMSLPDAPPVDPFEDWNRGRSGTS